MHSVRMRGRRFKSTPSQRPYHLPSEKNKVNPFDSPNFSIHDENVTSSAAENAKNEQLIEADVPVTSFYFDNSSSSEDIFVPTPVYQLMFNNLFLILYLIVKAGVMQRRIADKLIREFIVNLPFEFNNLSTSDNQTVHIRGLKFKISPAVINGFLENAVEPSSTPSHPSNDVLPSVLSRETLSICLVDGIPAVSLTLRHVGTFGVKIPIPLSQFFSSLLVLLNAEILTPYGCS
ncbi:uncharacterized protein E5676_scaffold447G00090 [Cucumis melo var. makuwa]|uniref:Flocculation protein FLO11-like n=1 Tax=Cucumis melo var. makuwa TaxID=1194695 RepID=A0A5A7SI49_CUCMM|nr:uncharacterized protein E6C27_scaffold34G001030 [Cucumis melo var. makuwa]TYK09616.1 uncharacterized protein E5676_scaffold447G00090 [Cucumis melo var. makuwa]